MENLIQADIFFFITSIFVVILTVSLIIIMVYVVKILRNIQEVSETVRSETKQIAGDIEHLRTEAKNGRISLISLFHFFKDMFVRRRKK